MSIVVQIVVLLLSLAAAAAVFASLFFAFIGLSKLFAKRRDDSDFGAMRYSWGVWTGSFDVAAKQKPVPVYLPGSRVEPDNRSRQVLVELSHRWPSIEETFLDQFAAEILEGDVPLESQKAYEDAARERARDLLLSLSDLSDISVEKHEETEELRLWVNFLHEWDPEHTRSLLLNEDLTFNDYGLTCGM